MYKVWLWSLTLTLACFSGAFAAPDDDKKDAATATEKKDEKKADAKKDEKKKDGPTVAVFRLNGEISEAPKSESLFGGLNPVSFRELLARLKKAADAANVKAVVLLPQEEALGRAQIEELRQAMAQVRAAGKDIYVHADSLSMSAYVIAAGATRISLVPTADLWLVGLHGESPYLRGLLDKIGVRPDFLTCGAYKSAAEIFMREGPSPEADKMTNWLLDSVYESAVQEIAKGRGVDPARVREWIDAGPYTARKAKEAGLIDAVEHRQALTDLLKEKYGKDVTFNHKYGDKKGPELDLSSPFAFLKVWSDLLTESQKKKTTKDAVGVVYVDGPIVLGGGEPSPFGSEEARSSDIRKALDEALRDEAIKAVVLRVDSPGGSAVASEIILDATKRVKAKKPFVVSMGNVAGSGGYYVACASDVIFAEPSTITASIGVLGGKFVTTDMWHKLGVSFKEYKRGENADILGSSRVWSATERDKMQTWMNEVYEVFKGHVTEIRGKKLKKPIDELAGGRVFTGKQALELGLVDKLGSLQDAVHYVAEQAKLKEYDVRPVPLPKNFLEQLLEEAGGGKDKPHEVGLSARLRAGAAPASVVDLALPYLQHLDPQRVRTIRAALQRLQLLQQEGAVLMMPELLIR